jgi:hypothetical protein
LIGDGDLDALIGAHEYEYSSDKSAFTGILWNDGKGKFPKAQQYSFNYARGLGWSA